MKVLYIVSDRRSGSTLLENLLSQISGVISVGELAFLKSHFDRDDEHFKIWNWQCSCKQNIENCVFWKKNYLEIDSNGLKTDFSSKPSAWQMLRQNAKDPRKLVGDEPDAILSNLMSIYQKIWTNESPKLIVDSSKNLITGLKLKEAYPESIVLLNLRRDFRAVAYSKIIRKDIKGFWKKLKMIAAAFLVHQSKEKYASDYDFVLDYETLATSTRSTIKKVIEELGITADKIPMQFGVLEDMHAIAGTPSRFEIKPITLDNRWVGWYRKQFGLRISLSLLNIFLK